MCVCVTYSHLYSWWCKNETSSTPHNIQLRILLFFSTTVLKRLKPVFHFAFHTCILLHHTEWYDAVHYEKESIEWIEWPIQWRHIACYMKSEKVTDWCDSCLGKQKILRVMMGKAKRIGNNLAGPNRTSGSFYLLQSIYRSLTLSASFSYSCPIIVVYSQLRKKLVSWLASFYAHFS